MNPFGFLSPFGISEAEQLRQAHEREAMLREEWRQANSGRVVEPIGDGAMARWRRMFGHILSARVPVTWPRVGLKARHPQPGC